MNDVCTKKERIYQELMVTFQCIEMVKSVLLNQISGDIIGILLGYYVDMNEIDHGQNEENTEDEPGNKKTKIVR